MMSVAMRIMAIALLLVSGCAAKRVVPPEPPISKSNIAAFDGVRLSVTNFSVRGTSKEDLPPAQNMLRQRFLDYVASASRFAELVDVGTSYVRKGNYHSRPVNLDLEVDIHLDHSAWRTWILDAPGIWPAVGYWPLTPQWGTATVELTAKLRDPQAGTLVEGKYVGECSYYMIWYSWYRTQPVEDAYRQATADAFDKLALDVAAKHGDILAKLGDRVPPPEMIVAATPAPSPPPPPPAAMPAELGERRSWIVAVMEITDTNSDDKKKAVDPQLIRNLSDQLRVFVAQKGLKVIDRGQQERAVRELTQELKADSYKSCFDTSCQIPLGKALAASHLLRSQVTRFGNACVLNGELIDLKREVTVAAGSARADCSEEGFLTASENVTSSLIGGTNGT